MKKKSVGLIGHGAIGSQISESLNAGLIQGVELIGVLDPFLEIPQKQVASIQVPGIQELCQLKPDLIMEAAGHIALQEYSETILRAGIDLLVASVGALGDEALMNRLLEISAEEKVGRFIISTGAIGGADIFEAVKLAGKIKTAEIVSIKPVGNLLVPELDAKVQEELRQATTQQVIVYSGKARDALELFPQSANVCATFGFATLGLDETKATIIGDPTQNQVVHQLKVSGESGDYELTFKNHASSMNPKTSAIVPFSILSALKSWNYWNTKDAADRAAPYIFL